MSYPHTDEGKKKADELSHQILGAAIEVHCHLGPGLLESAYEECLCHELTLRGLAFERQLHQPFEYKGVQLPCGYRLDVKVEGLVIVELKAIERLDAIHEAQLLTYLRLQNLWLGLLINFNVVLLKNGIKRMVN